MSDNEHEETKAQDTVKQTQGSAPEGEAVVDTSASTDNAAAAGTRLTDLMADGADSGTATPQQRPDLDAEALLAAQQAIEVGEQALAQARAQLATERAPQRKPGSKKRELVLRLLLAANVLAMIIVVMLPMAPGTEPAPETGTSGTTPAEPPVVPTTGPQLTKKYNLALLAHESGDNARALGLMKSYLEDSPNMAESRKISVYRQMAYYASLTGRPSEAGEFDRKAQMIAESHKLPEDLIAMAKAAYENGDQEGLRQVWARFLLQQRQIPHSLYQHVAEAYLQLGDSYRVEANEAAEQARLEELRKTEQLLRKQAKVREAR